ncbi:retrotransposon protein, putative, ty1-copia subclass [Tanacetum coccineum]
MVDKTPYELWYGKVPNLSYLKVWGCEALVKRDTPDKLQQRYVKCILIGYPKETMGYYFYFPLENKIVVARYAEFFEKNLLSQEVIGRAGEFEKIQDKKYILLLNSIAEIPIEAEEMQSMKDNQVWRLVDLPPDSRLMAKRFTQLYRVDYEETFSPVADIRAINPEVELRVDCYCNDGFETDRDEIKFQTRYVFILNGRRSYRSHPAAYRARSLSGGRGACPEVVVDLGSSGGRVLRLELFRLEHLDFAHPERLDFARPVLVARPERGCLIGKRFGLFGLYPEVFGGLCLDLEVVRIASDRIVSLVREVSSVRRMAFIWFYLCRVRKAVVGQYFYQSFKVLLRFFLTFLMAKKDMHIYVSQLKDVKLKTLIATYDIPLDLRPRLPDSNFRMINLPAGDTSIGIYSRIFDSSGVRIPFPLSS